MASFNVLNNKDKQALLSRLNNQFGISKIDGSFITFGHDKFRVFTGVITADQISTLKQFFRLEILGSYFFTLEGDGDNDIRLSHDAAIILRDQITKNFVVIDKAQEFDWLRGKDVSLTPDQVKDYELVRGFVVVKCDGEVVGCGRISQDGRLRNFVPKERRIK
ncbi:MAG: hypothetical protein AABW73_04960 [Nanoarchaeota archaeon]